MKDSLNDVNRAMPFSRDAEDGVLSCYLQNPVGLLGEAHGKVEAGWFYHPATRFMFELLLEFNQAGRPIDIVTLSAHLLDKGMMDKIGSPAQLGDWLAFVPTPAHYEYYLKILRDRWWERECLRVTQAIQKAVYETGQDGDVEKLVTMAIGDLLNLGNLGRKSRWVHVKEVVKEVCERTAQALKNKGHVTSGVATGFTDLDRRTMGLRPGELFILGARPAMGKTALAMNIAENIVLANGHYSEFNQVPLGVAIVSLEMSRLDLTDRTIVGRAGVSMGQLATGMFGKREMKAYMAAAEELEQSELWFLDVGKLSIQELLSSLRQMVLEKGIKVVVVDYLQRLCSDSKRAQQNRNVEVAEISTGLKQMAKELGLVVIALAQVGRGAEERPGCKPSLADLRESGDIEADADWVGLLYRPGYYERKKAKKEGKGNKGQGKVKWSSSAGAGASAGDGVAEEAEDEIRDDQAELIIAKARRGSTEPVYLTWDGPRTRFSSQTSKLFSNNNERREGGGGAGAVSPQREFRSREDEIWGEVNGDDGLGLEPEEG